MKQHQTVKVWKSTVRLMRLAYALTGESMCALTDRLFAAEVARLREEGEADAPENGATTEADA